MHAIARVAIFRDQRLVGTHPELAIKSHKTGQAWRRKLGKLVWNKTEHPRVCRRMTSRWPRKAGRKPVLTRSSLTTSASPAEGDQKDATFYYQTEHPDWHRSDVIAEYIQRQQRNSVDEARRKRCSIRRESAITSERCQPG